MGQLVLPVPLVRQVVAVSQVFLVHLVHPAMDVTVAMANVVNQVRAVELAIQVHKVLSAPPVFVIHHNAIQNSQLIPRDQVKRAPMKTMMSQRSKLVFPPKSPPQLMLSTLT